MEFQESANVGSMVAMGDMPEGIDIASDAALLFFDVDGTLLWMDEEDLEGDAEFTDFGPSESVARAFEQLHENGHHAFLCTGRPLAFVQDNVRNLGFTGYITGAGACISFGDRIVREELINTDLVLEAAQEALKLETPVMLESREKTVVLSKRGAHMKGFPDIPVAKSVEELKQLAPELHFCKLCSMFKDAEDAPEAIEAFRAYMRAHFTECDMGLAFEFSPRGVNKGAGIAHVLELLGRDKHNTYAFGDSENDLPMFPAVETAVAMENAMDVLKERADYVTGHAAGDGIAQGLRHFGLI